MKVAILAIAVLVLGVAVGIGSSVAQLTIFPEVFNGKPEDFALGWDRPKAGGKVVVHPFEKYDFGEMGLLTTKSHTFTFENVGKERLSIKLLNTTCKCTTADIKKDVLIYLAPYEKKEVNLEWHAEEYIDPFTQTATFETSDPDRPFVRLFITGHLTRTLRASPDEIDFADITASQSATKIARIYAYKDDDIGCRKHEWQDPKMEEFFDVDVRKLSLTEVRAHGDNFAQSGLEVAVTVKPERGLPREPFQQRLSIFTTAGVDKPMVLPVKGVVVGEITIGASSSYDRYDNVVSLGNIEKEKGKSVSVQIWLRGPDRDTIQLTVDEDQTDPASILQVEIGKARSNDVARIVPLTITVPPNSRTVDRSGSRQGKIVINTNHPTEKTIELYVDFAVGE